MISVETCQQIYKDKVFTDPLGGKHPVSANTIIIQSPYPHPLTSETETTTSTTTPWRWSNRNSKESSTTANGGPKKLN